MRYLVSMFFATFTVLILLSSCEEEKRYYVKNIGSGESTPTMRTFDVNTMVSDSGYTKYFIHTPQWDMYNDAHQPYWFFPNGVDLEQYDTALNVEATVRCDSAKYLTQERLWRLDGRVVMVNVARDSFLTNQLFWDQSERKLYSDSFIHIVRSDRIIEGYGFESNENMTSYIVTRPTGIFPVPEKSGNSGSTSEIVDEPTEGRRMAPAPRRASEREPMPYGNDAGNGVRTLSPPSYLPR